MSRVQLAGKLRGGRRGARRGAGPGAYRRGLQSARLRARLRADRLRLVSLWMPCGACRTTGFPATSQVGEKAFDKSKRLSSASCAAPVTAALRVGVGSAMTLATVVRACRAPASALRAVPVAFAAPTAV